MIDLTEYKPRYIKKNVSMCEIYPEQGRIKEDACTDTPLDARMHTRRKGEEGVYAHMTFVINS